MNKKALFEQCNALVEARIAAIQHTIDQAKQASFDESKSSMGDKYETTKSLLQHEQEKMAVQLNEALKMKKALQQIGCKSPKAVVEAGSLVITSGPNFYLTASLGKITFDESDVFVISPVSPIGKTLLGARVKDVVTFNNSEISIEAIH